MKLDFLHSQVIAMTNEQLLLTAIEHCRDRHMGAVIGLELDRRAQAGEGRGESERHRGSLLDWLSPQTRPGVDDARRATGVSPRLTGTDAVRLRA